MSDSTVSWVADDDIEHEIDESDHLKYKSSLSLAY